MYGNIVTLIGLVVLWGAGCFYLIKVKESSLFNKPKLVNLLCIIFCFICHIISMLITLFDVGFNDWNFQNMMPYANVSPFLFITSPIYFVLPKGIKKYFLNLVSLLTIGMIISPIASLVHYISISYAYHAKFLLDFVPHLVFSLWGVYIIQSKQITLNIKDSIISGSSLVATAIIMLILNVIFDRSFFGLSLNGKHSIYNVVLVSNSYLSAGIYFTGLIVALLLGYLFQKLCNHLSEKEKNRN